MFCVFFVLFVGVLLLLCLLLLLVVFVLWLLCFFVFLFRFVFGMRITPIGDVQRIEY